MDIKLTKEEVMEIRAVLLIASEGLDTILQDFSSSEGVEVPKALDEVLENPVTNAIWQMGRVFEILDLAECEQEANDNEIRV